MSSEMTRLQQLKVGGGSVVFFLIAVLGLLGLAVLLVWPWWVVASVAASAVVLALPIFLVRRWRARGREGWSPARSYASTSIVLFLLISAIAAFPIYYLAYLVDARPTLAPLMTLTNGKKTVQFQGMQHIGSEGFYKSVVYDLREALAGGYRLYYEGVKEVEGRRDLSAWFNALATQGAGADLSAFYKSLADGCGMKFQLDYFKGLTADFPVHPDRHFVADVSYLDLKTEYDRLMREDADFARAVAATSGKSKVSGETEAFKYLLGLWKAASPEQKKLMGFACRGFFSWSFSQAQKPSHMDKLILDYRNAFVARSIVEDKADKIWITYGAHHATGIVDQLKKLDPNWRVVSIKWSRTIANPDDHKGELK